MNREVFDSINSKLIPDTKLILQTSQKINDKALSPKRK